MTTAETEPKRAVSFVPISRADSDAVLARLLSVYQAQVDHVNGQAHVPFSGQPEQDLGALKIAYDSTVKALVNEQEDVISGARDAGAWMTLAKSAEQDLKDIGGYDDGATVSADVSFVAKESAKQVEKVVQETVIQPLKNAIPWWVLPALVIGAIAALYFALRKVVL